jgi:predicted lipoprotein
MTRRCVTAITGTALALALAAPAYPQSANRSGSPPTAPSKHAGSQISTSMDEMMNECREHCSTATRQMDDMMKMMSDARRSNDPAKMRGALEDAQKPLTTMKGHMDQCMTMIDIMQKAGAVKR